MNDEASGVAMRGTAQQAIEIGSLFKNLISQFSAT